MIPALLERGRWLVLTGAGVSTDSGIPDYRGPAAPTRTPMTYQEFVSGVAAQQRYWASAHVGWSRMRQAEPNAGHHALARLQSVGAAGWLVTQNVDGLHERAGSDALALHGRIAEVVCLDCGAVSARATLADRLEEANPDWLRRYAGVAVRPDGDADLDDAGVTEFVVPGCADCGGRLKPHVVFFGENVPRDRVERVRSWLGLADGLVVVGSSLTVMSGFRFVREAARAGQPVVIVNRGSTRGDDLATAKIDAGCSPWLQAWLGSRVGAASLTPG